MRFLFVLWGAGWWVVFLTPGANEIKRRYIQYTSGIYSYIKKICTYHKFPPNPRPALSLRRVRWPLHVEVAEEHRVGRDMSHEDTIPSQVPKEGPTTSLASFCAWNRGGAILFFTSGRKMPWTGLGRYLGTRITSATTEYTVGHKMGQKHFLSRMIMCRAKQ